MDQPPPVNSPAIRNRRGKRSKRIITLLLLLLGGYAAIIAALTWNTLRPKRGAPSRTPLEYGLKFEKISFTSRDGVVLAGWFIPATESPRGVIILCHGLDGAKTAMLPKAAMLRNAGFTTLLFDFRARGESGGNLCTLGKQEVNDLLFAVRWVQGRSDCRGLPIGVLGDSLGGSVALMAASRDKSLFAVAVEAPFARLDHAITNHFQLLFGPISPLFALPTQWMGEMVLQTHAADIAPVREIDAIGPRPLLIISDAEDSLCPQQEASELMVAAGNPKTLWTVANADHIEAIQVDRTGYESKVIYFFNDALKRRNHVDGRSSEAVKP